MQTACGSSWGRGFSFPAGHCRSRGAGVTCVPETSYVEHLTPRTSEGPYVEIGLLRIGFQEGEVIRVSPNQTWPLSL